MMALDNTFLFSTQPFGHGNANELLNPPGNFSPTKFSRLNAFISYFLVLKFSFFRLIIEMESSLGDFLEDNTCSWVENCKRRRLSTSSLNDAFPTGEDLQDLLEVTKFTL
jgi:hypothetical protein